MPQVQHTAHGGVDQTVGHVVVGSAVRQKFNDGGIHFHRSDAGLIVDSLQIVDAFVVIVDIKELMVDHQVIVDGLGLYLEFLFRFGKSHDGGDRVEEGQESGCVLFGSRLSLGASGQQKTQGQDQSDEPFHISSEPLQSEPGNRRWQW